VDDDISTPEQRMQELTRSAEVMRRLAADGDAFAEAVAAFRAQDPDRFQAVLGRVGLLDDCRLVCRFLCSKHCVFICRRLMGDLEGGSDKLDVEEWRQFAEFTGRLAGDEQLLGALVDAVDKEDPKAFQELLERLDARRFGHQLCHWLCQVRCRLACRLLCPPPPLVTQVGLIPAGQIAPSGYAAGPSFPPGPTPPDAKSPGGVGDHPYGGTANIRGVFNLATATEYKVEVTPAGGGAPLSVTTPIGDYRFNPAWPGPGQPLFIFYTRAATGDWYAIADMGLLGVDYLTDWSTGGVPDGEYDVRLIVRSASLVERSSPPVRVVVDNTGPSGPGPGGRPSMTIRQGDRELGCCETVRRDGGPLTIHIEGEDLNFSSLSVVLYGGCDEAVSIFGRSYDGNLADRGAPAPGIDIPWDPWRAEIESCCYVIFFRIYDRAITNNAWSGGNSPGETWRSITIA